MKTSLYCFAPVIFLAILSTVAGCGGDDSTATGSSGGSGGSGGAGGSGGSGGAPSDAASDAPAETKIASSMGDWTVYPNPYGDGGASPISDTIKGTAEAFSFDGGTKMRVKLTVSGLPANRPFGSHIHKLACDDPSKAGGHYQNMPFPDGGSANDPAYANSTNEVWLDFVTDATGAGSSEAVVNWIPRAGEAKAVMIHDMTTMDGGVAGAKLACLSMPF